MGGDARFAWPAAHSAAGRLEPIHDARLVRVITSWMVLSWAAVQPCTQDSNADQGKPEKAIARSSKRSSEAVNTSTRG